MNLINRNLSMSELFVKVSMYIKKNEKIPEAAQGGWGGGPGGFLESQLAASASGGPLGWFQGG